MRVFGIEREIVGKRKGKKKKKKYVLL